MRKGSSCIFDEVITGFRAAYGARKNCTRSRRISPPSERSSEVAFRWARTAARREIMEKVAPLGGVYQAGTLSGNPLAMTAGIETLNLLKSKKVYQDLENKTSYLAEAISRRGRGDGNASLRQPYDRVLTVFFTEGPVKDYRQQRQATRNDFPGSLSK